MQVLTYRQRQVLDLVQKGKSNKEIGSKLGVSHGTAKVHVCKLLSIFGVKHRYQLFLINEWEGILSSLDG